MLIRNIKTTRHGMNVRICWLHSQFNTPALLRWETNGNVKKGKKKRKENDCIIWCFGSPPSARPSPQAGARAALDELIRHRALGYSNLSFMFLEMAWKKRGKDVDELVFDWYKPLYIREFNQNKKLFRKNINLTKIYNHAIHFFCHLVVSPLR